MEFSDLSDELMMYDAVIHPSKILFINVISSQLYLVVEKLFI